MKDLYKELVYDGNEFGEAGLASAEAALFMGALVEELDIRDLQDAIGDNPPGDVTRAYENLMNGSHNHLRAIVDQLERRGITGDEGYTARVLTQDEVDAILDGTKGRGRKR